MEKETAGSYLFVVYDCNDESKMKIVLRYRDYADGAREVDMIARNLFERKSLEDKLEDTAWCEIWKLSGRRTK